MVQAIHLAAAPTVELLRDPWGTPHILATPETDAFCGLGYAAAVNAWREANPDAVARRFKPLGLQPEPWTPTDCLLAARGIL